MRQVALDTETTGFRTSEGHRITEIGCVEIINRKVTNNFFQTYLNPEREVSEGAARVTGLTWELLADKPKFAEIADDFIDFIGDSELIIHNASFDIGFLDFELQKINHKVSSLRSNNAIIDTLELAKKIHRTGCSLDKLCDRYNIDRSMRTLHGALLDSQILAEVYLLMTKGQLAFDYQQEQSKSQLAYGRSNKIIQTTATLKTPSITASELELQLHNKFIEMLKNE